MWAFCVSSVQVRCGVHDNPILIRRRSDILQLAVHCSDEITEVPVGPLLSYSYLLRCHSTSVPTHTYTLVAEDVISLHQLLF
jgi:hypothetical protein